MHAKLWPTWDAPEMRLDRILVRQDVCSVVGLKRVFDEPISAHSKYTGSVPDWLYLSDHFGLTTTIYPKLLNKL
jgi:endonuclease/exonuclease/phosphatase family metal-dependent hydrolase